MGLRDFIKSKLADKLANSKAKEMQAGAAAKTDAIRQQDYDAARRSMLGDFAGTPIAGCPQCMANAKAQRRAERLQLVNTSMLTCPEHAAEAQRLRADMDEVENMRCAKQVYIDNDPNAPADLKTGAPLGFTKATPDQLAEMGLDQDMLTPPNSEFKAAVYMKDPEVWGEDMEPPTIVAFRGSTPATEDWVNNFHQDADMEAPYYRNAVQIGNTLADNGTDARLVGHSLGGGLASAAQGGSGLPASTYNSAGLNSSTVARYTTDANHTAADASQITAIRVKGEILTKTQENLVGSRGLSLMANSAVGTKRDIDPVHDPAYLDALKADGKAAATDDYSTYLHGMDEVIGSMEKEKSADEATLKACAAEHAQ
jgi:hypothetical protein